MKRASGGVTVKRESEWWSQRERRSVSEKPCLVQSGEAGREDESAHTIGHSKHLQQQPAEPSQINPAIISHGRQIELQPTAIGHKIT